MNILTMKNNIFASFINEKLELLHMACEKRTRSMNRRNFERYIIGFLLDISNIYCFRCRICARNFLELVSYEGLSERSALNVKSSLGSPG